MYTTTGTDGAIPLGLLPAPTSSPSACRSYVMHPDRTAIVFKPYAGKTVTAAVVSAALRVFEDFVYETELASEDGHDHALMFRARVGDKQIQGCDFLHHDQDGLVDQLTVMVRPLSAALGLRERMATELEALGASRSVGQTADGRGTVRVSDPYGRPRMRVPSTAHTSRPWRIHERVDPRSLWLSG